jgi:hypothetical protein
MGLSQGPTFSAAEPLLSWYGLAMSLLALTNVIASYSIALHRFAFGIPLVSIAFAEILWMIFSHPSLRNVVATLIIGNALALAVVVVSVVFQNGTKGLTSRC